MGLTTTVMTTEIRMGELQQIIQEVEQGKVGGAVLDRGHSNWRKTQANGAGEKLNRVWKLEQQSTITCKQKGRYETHKKIGQTTRKSANHKEIGTRGEGSGEERERE